jgi:tetrahydromethanopterin S-methyltransferase subunit G
MHLMRESWTDARLDDLNEKVDRGFAKVDERFEKIDERFERLETKIDAKFDALYKFMLQAVLGTMAIMVGGFATLLAAVIWV